MSRSCRLFPGHLKQAAYLRNVVLSTRVILQSEGSRVSINPMEASETRLPVAWTLKPALSLFRTTYHGEAELAPLLPKPNSQPKLDRRMLRPSQSATSKLNENRIACFTSR